MVKEEGDAEEEEGGRPHSTPRFDAVLMALLEGMRCGPPPITCSYCLHCLLVTWRPLQPRP